jgi:hypothetical protein
MSESIPKLQFAARELHPWLRTVRFDELVVHDVYYGIDYLDERLQLPHIRTLVYLGIDLCDGDKNKVYFQDLDSFAAGVTLADFEEPVTSAHGSFYTGSSDHLGWIFNFEDALEELMRCSLRRQGTSR